MYLSFLVLALSLLTYFSIGRSLVVEKKIFFIQFLYILFYFLIAPILHIYNDFYAADLFFYDFKAAIQSLNIINIIGIFFIILGFLFAQKINLNFSNQNKSMNWKLLYKISFLYFIFSFLYFFYLVLTTNIFYTEAKTELEASSLIQYMILESTPIIVAWGIIAYLKNYDKKDFLLYFLIFTLLTILFAGLRGSRVTIIFNIINFLLLYSFLIRKIDIKTFIPLLVLGVIFNTVYSNYKYAGLEGVKNYFSTGEKSKYISSKENENLHFLLGDLARSDVQAKIIENIEYDQYKPSYMPETYIKAIALILPDKLNIENFESKRILGTEALYGFKGNDDYSSSRIYGLLGESLINFGFWSLAFSFFIYGVIHSFCLKGILLVRNNKYILFLPLLFFMPIYFLFYDLDNIIFQLLKNWLIPLFLFILYSLALKNE